MKTIKELILDNAILFAGQRDRDELLCDIAEKLGWKSKEFDDFVELLNKAGYKERDWEKFNKLIDNKWKQLFPDYEDVTDGD